jgi:hypothetical protein
MDDDTDEVGWNMFKLEEQRELALGFDINELLCKSTTVADFSSVSRTSSVRFSQVKD